MKTVIKKARKGQYERKYRTTGKTGPASECVTKKMEKPTAQSADELREKILQLIASATLADHIGDMWEALEKVAKDIGEEGLMEYENNYSEVRKKLFLRGIKTVYGTDVWSG